jgi:hypothetical protein
MAGHEGDKTVMKYFSLGVGGDKAWKLLEMGHSRTEDLVLGNTTPWYRSEKMEGQANK